jgi:hypothetical protein
LATAIEAVNHGRMFRFLTKPVSGEAFALAVRASLEQHRLMMAEQELLGRTLTGAIGTMVELVGRGNPVAAGRTRRVHAPPGPRLAKALDAPLWEVEIAAALPAGRTLPLPPRDDRPHPLRPALESGGDRGACALPGAQG